MPALPPELDAAVEAHWQAALRGSPRLFNGSVFSVDDIQPRRLTGHWTEFRRVLAQMREPALQAGLGLRQLAVCGAIDCTHDGTGTPGTILGRREPKAVYLPGAWQLPPAGSVDKSNLDADGHIDLRRQLLTELHEELGVPDAAVVQVQPICMVEHPDSHVLDLGFAIKTTWSAEAILSAHRTAGNGEYDTMRFLPLADVPQTIAELGESLMMPARILLGRLTAA